MPKIKVDKGVPLPSNITGVGKYPWEDMEVGDSFLFPPDVKSSAAYSVSRHQKRKGRDYVVRATPQGLRCWRTK
jgi:hypothetical protein